MHEKKVQAAVAETGLHRVGDYLPEDVFIASYPKSGTTWVGHLLVEAAFGVNLGLTPSRLVENLIVDTHYLKYFHRFFDFAFFKTHLTPQPEFRRVIHLVRDGRDSMVSYYHYLCAITGQEIDFVRMIKTGEYFFPCRWVEHTEQWLANPYKAEILTVRYEDLKKDAVKELSRICEFAGLKREREILETAVQRASFGSMQKREEVFGWDKDRAFPKDKKFVRRGVIGSHKDEMPAAASELFLQEAGATLKKLGYM
jgi:hypothetical protein